MSNHTPGPWTAIWDEKNRRTHVGDWHIFARAENAGTPVRFARNVRRENVNAEANARLIAAAPELLDTAQQLLMMVKQSIDDVGGCDHEAGICICSDIAAADRAQELIERLK